MKEVKTPKKPLIYYYGIVLLVLIVFNLVVSPILMEHQVEETDYGTFMSMINDKNIGKVEVEDNQIVFTDKNNEKIYKTGLRNDPDLTDRLYECGATFTKDIDQQTCLLYTSKGAAGTSSFIKRTVTICHSDSEGGERNGREGA